MKIKTFLARGLIAVSILSLCGGCALFVIGGAAAAGAGTYAYVDGELKGSEGVSLTTAYNATLAAMNDFQFAVVSKKSDAATATVIARTASDQKVEITLNKQSATVTEIRIRVGTFGDKDLSEQIREKIKSHF
jgi:hypothetical protein